MALHTLFKTHTMHRALLQGLKRVASLSVFTASLCGGAA